MIGMKPSLGRKLIDEEFLDLPITSSSKFKDLDGNVVTLKTYVNWYGFIPTYSLQYKQYEISFTDIDDMSKAELTLCMVINQKEFTND